MPAEIDAVNADTVRQALRDGGSYDAAVLIIDMSRTTFCDSAGVQVLIEAYHRTAAARTRPRLVATAVTRVLTLIGVDRLMPIYPTLEAALADTPGG